MANVWDFATQGTLNTLAFKIDHQFENTPAGTSLQLLFGVRQNGTTYYHDGFFPVGPGYQTASISGSTQANFGSVFVVGAPQPNFCAIGNGGLSECSTVPEPATVVMLGGALLIAGRGAAASRLERSTGHAPVRTDSGAE